MRRRLSAQSRRPMRAAFLILALLCASPAAADEEHTLLVTATAYNSLEAQTGSNPNVALWGDVLTPGTRSIAVSRDLIALGLGHRTRVRIEGLQGEFLVLDKMAARWKQKIDLYMGEDVAAARQFGVRVVRIWWRSE